ncbi:MAG: glycine--tRNA ligase subunit beta [Leptolinea sp.]|jgi:glycyl-tRNA synthetase|nr:glycine--tRNA ligase subunit beta [Leptolinea sp.]
MPKPLDFQSIMLTLEKFWAEKGCLVWQPYYTQVGAGTMNPATYLRVLGPEPWSVAYVEPSVRPDDGRYGENPNRLQQHYQFQVILKPDPGNPQELYLDSLRALGIDPAEHDIRFVEDNWESPALGAWGLGWEVWLDGQEITQFTYFQQAGGIVLDPNAVEITYGLERIAIALQKVRSFREIQWSANRKYGEVNLQAEREHSQYYFEVADVERLRQMYNLFEAEAEASLAKGLVLPAHDYVLKCSHTFNILDTRGAVGVTERQALFSRMRDLARRVAEAYVAQRAELGYPWGKVDSATVNAGKTSAAAVFDSAAAPTDPQTFLLEIGTEELPAADLQSALEQLTEHVPAMLADLRLGHGDIKVNGTPRRLTVQVGKLSPRQADKTSIIKGPPADRAFDTDGKPTPAATGFARGKGLKPEDLKVMEIDGGRYAAAEVHETGKPAGEVLKDALAELVAAIKFDKVMRWNESQAGFSRPVRWLFAMFGKQVIPFRYAGLTAGNITRGLRFDAAEEISVKSADAYADALKSRGILLDPQVRRSVIADQVSRLAVSVGGKPEVDEPLLDEVNNLVERPTALLGKFDPDSLKLPAEVLISVMKKHQRYFPVIKPDGELLPYFIAVRNGDDQALDIVTDGNEQVIRARFADAAFFINEDVRFKLEEFVPQLSTLIFQFKLGSMLDRTTRIEKLVGALKTSTALSSVEEKTALRAAHLCKADLATHMVVEMTSLQGVMGGYYARRSGEDEAVARAIVEHYLPKSTGDASPSTKPGLVVSLADRLDMLAGLFAAGLAPTGTKDPYAQRRAALGLVQSLIAWDMDFDLGAGLAMAAGNLPVSMSAEASQACLEFIIGRLKGLLTDQGYRYDVVDAVLAAQGGNPAGAARACKQLTAWVQRNDWNTILPAFSRCVRITRGLKETFTVKPDSLKEPSEQALYAQIVRMENALQITTSVDDFLNGFLPAIDTVNTFFDAVLVMSEDAQEKANRLGMLQRIARLPERIVDLSELEGF